MLVTCGSQVDLHWVALGMDCQTLLATEFYLYRLLEQPGKQGCMVLDTHVFLAPKATTDKHAMAMDLFRGKFEHAAYLFLLVID